MRNLILYTTDDGTSQIQLRADLSAVWLPQLEMAELFHTTKQNIAKYLKAIFTEQELYEEAVVNQWLTTAVDGKNYRVRSPHEVQFRRWASTVLAEYLNYDQRRKTQEAQEADTQDDAELKALENQIKNRPLKG